MPPPPWVTPSPGDSVRPSRPLEGSVEGHSALGEPCVGPQSSTGASLYLQSDSQDLTHRDPRVMCMACSHSGLSRISASSTSGPGLPCDQVGNRTLGGTTERFWGSFLQVRAFPELSLYDLPPLHPLEVFLHFTDGKTRVS